MKKICFVTTISMTLKAFVIDLADYLHSTGEYDITFVCDTDEEFSKKLPSYIHYVPIPMKRGVNLSGIKAIFEMTALFKKEKFDLVQYSTPNASFYASCAAKISKIPVRLYCQWGIAYVGFKGFKRSILKFCEKIVCSLSTWIEPDSQSNLAFSYMEGLYGPEKSSVIWNGSASGVNLSKFNIDRKEEYRCRVRKKHFIPEEAFVYGFVGRITGDKGINELFSAMIRILETDRDSYLLLVGNPEKTNSVNPNLYEWAINEPHVIFCGFTEVVEQYFSAMDCFILPSYREGFGLGVIEAEAMGVPVIVTDIPGPTDAMIDGVTGILVRLKDVDSLVEAMLTLKKNPEMCDNYSKHGHEFSSINFNQQVLFELILVDRLRLLEY